VNAKELANDKARTELAILKFSPPAWIGQKNTNCTHAELNQKVDFEKGRVGNLAFSADSADVHKELTAMQKLSKHQPRYRANTFPFQPDCITLRPQQIPL